MVQLDLFECSMEHLIECFNTTFKKHLSEYSEYADRINREGWVDEDGYPTEQALHYIATFPGSEYDAVLKRIESMWWGKVYGGWEAEQSVDGIKYHISTLGWSGNESIITAMKQNELMWEELFFQEKRGGHFILTTSC